ncbi:MAG: glycosyltransferase family 39 protein [Chloroflexota bacterium]|nr:glycosyltransferase family 39 protein [Chloroflexota bacterium]
MSRITVALVALLIFVASLLLRLPHLDGFLTPDESVWSVHSAIFLQAMEDQDWAATNVSGHPGVTTSWAGMAGLVAKGLIAPPAGADTLRDAAQMLLDDPVRLDFLPWLRLPVALLTSLGVVLIYLLSRKLMREWVAILAAAFIVFDPFLLSHGRVLQMDALLTTFMTIAWVALLVATRTGKRRYHLFSGLAMGLAILTKSPALVLGPLMLGWILFWRSRSKQPATTWLGEAAIDLVAVGLPTLLVIIAGWPSLWIAPLATTDRVVSLMTTYGGVGHELGNFWLGQPVADPGYLFYPAALLLRTTVVTAIGLLLALVVGVIGWLRPGSGEAADSISPDQSRGMQGFERTTMAGLALYVLWFGTILSFGDKKFDRYLLPVFPSLDILAAWGGTAAIVWLMRLFPTKSGEKGRPANFNNGHCWLAVALGVALIAGQAWSALVNLPTYLTAYNPLVGGIRTAEKTMVVGWGEGLEEAADFLNQQDNAADKRVASWYGRNVFGAFFDGESYDSYYDLPTAADLYAKDVDFVVTYVNQMQRDRLDGSVLALLGKPIMTSSNGSVPLAEVYSWPKPFEHTTVRELAPGLTLTGWTVGEHDPASGLPVTLFWDAGHLSRGAAGLPSISIWMKDVAGDVWATAVAPALDEKSAIVSGWLEQPAIAQTLMLHPPVGLLAGRYRLEIAPVAGEPFALDTVDILPARRHQVTDLEIDPPGETILFGDAVRFLGHRMDVEGDHFDLELLWQNLGSPPEGIKYFVHVVDENDTIVSQRDGILGAMPNQVEAVWPTDTLLRHRIRLPLLPGDETSSVYRVFVGAYLPDGQRLPLSVAGQLVPDERLLLASLGE